MAIGDRLGRDLHDVGNDFAVMWLQEVNVDDPDLPVLVDLEMDVHVGRLVVSSFRARRRPGGPAVSIDILKSMPLVRLASRAAGPDLLGALLKVRRVGSTTSYEPADPAELENLDEIEMVAVIYRVAYFFGMPPTAAVASEMGFSRDVAAKRVQAARRAGLLEPTIKGKKGP